jgi:hypothetical protein
VSSEGESLVVVVLVVVGKATLNFPLPLNMQIAHSALYANDAHVNYQVYNLCCAYTCLSSSLLFFLVEEKTQASVT